MQFPFEPEASTLLASHPVLGPKVNPSWLPHSWALSSWTDVSVNCPNLPGSLGVSSSTVSILEFYLILGWILLILCCVLVSKWTWDFCSLVLLVCGHPGLLHTTCHPANRWKLNKKFSEQTGLEKALVRKFLRFPSL